MKQIIFLYERRAEVSRDTFEKRDRTVDPPHRRGLAGVSVGFPHFGSRCVYRQTFSQRACPNSHGRLYGLNEKPRICHGERSLRAAHSSLILPRNFLTVLRIAFPPRRRSLAALVGLVGRRGGGGGIAA
jgi:hypothetical protein